jgi:arabinose-5-phosphate isomerase
LTRETPLQFARQVLEAEAAAVRGVTGAIDASFERAARLMLECKGSVLTSGVGKAGHVARKLSATLASTGTPSHFLSAADAVHGDLGSIRGGDIVLILSASGESDEILRLLNLLKKLGHPVIAMTASATSGLGKSADIVLAMGNIDEACPLGLAPSASTTAMMALGDALALTVMKLRNFTAEDFALFHPGGHLGRKLIRVKEAMWFRRGENLAMASDQSTIAQMLHEVGGITRRSGAVALVDAGGKLSGIFSDADLRRLLTGGNPAVLSKKMADVMTRSPKHISENALASEAMALMRQFRIDELPVVDDQDRPVGMIDIQDLVVLRMLDVGE